MKPFRTWCEHCGAIQEVQGDRCVHCGRNLVKLRGRILIWVGSVLLVIILPLWLTARFAPTSEEREAFKQDRMAKFQTVLLEIDRSRTLFEDSRCHIELYVGDTTIIVVTGQWYSLDSGQQMAIIHELSRKIKDIVATTNPWRLEDVSGRLLGGHGALRGDYLLAD